MKTSKRILAVVLTVVLAFSVFAVSAFAVDGSMTYTVVADSTNYATGDTVTVNIYLKNDYNATCLRFPVLYSADVFEVPTTGVRLTAYDDCLTYKGSLEANTSNDASLYPEEYDSSAYGCVLVQWTASVTSTNIGCFNSAESVKCFSFQLKVKSTAGGATGSIFIPSESTLFYNQAVTDVTDATTICRINTTLNFEGLDVEIDAGGSDGITTYAGSQVIIDYNNKTIKNWAGLTMSLATIKANVQPLGNATLTYAVSSGTAGTYGTGAKVRVWLDGALLDDYYILIYGDIDGDGTVAANDSSALTKVTAGLADLETGIFTTAADLDASGDVNAADSSNLVKAVAGLTDIDQTV
ncbi:MAG: hypothetical protein IJZ57_09285 [Clostridia bacterium]|nr:hypothetical protein [Clostridia bacterium]